MSLFILGAHPDSANDTGRIAHNSAVTCRVSAPGCRPWSSSAFFLSPSLSEKHTPQLGGRCFVSTPRRWGPNQRQMSSPCQSVLLSHSTHSCCEHTKFMVLGYGPGRLVPGGVKLRHCQGHTQQATAFPRGRSVTRPGLIRTTAPQ